MKKLLEMVDVKKLMAFMATLKGKSPLFMGLAALLFVIAAVAIQLGYVSADLVGNEQIVDFLNGLLASPAKPAVIDTVQNVVVDSLPK